MQRSHTSDRVFDGIRHRRPGQPASASRPLTAGAFAGLRAAGHPTAQGLALHASAEHLCDETARHLAAGSLEGVDCSPTDDGRGWIVAHRRGAALPADLSRLIEAARENGMAFVVATPGGPTIDGMPTYPL